MELTIWLSPEELKALRKFEQSRTARLTLEQAARLALRDFLIGIGDLPLGLENRSPRAGN